MKTTRSRIGLILLGIVVLCWLAVPILPFISFPYKVIIITSLLVGGEILFVVTVALLGKEYWLKKKNGFKKLFIKQDNNNQIN